MAIALVQNFHRFDAVPCDGQVDSQLALFKRLRREPHIANIVLDQ